MKKWMIAACMALFMMILMINGANAQNYSGSCGAQLRWSMSTTTGILTITGSGPMDDYSYSAPWYTYYIRDYLKKIVVSPGCTSIGATAFSQLSELTDVTLSDTVASLGDECLKSCKKLTSITMPGVKHLGKQCFWNCQSLTEIELPETLESIGEYCFDRAAIQHVLIPASVTSAGECAVVAEKSITFAEGFTGLGCVQRAFAGKDQAAFYIPDSFCNTESEIIGTGYSLMAHINVYARTGSIGAMTLGRFDIGFIDPSEEHLVKKTYLYDDEGESTGLRLDAIYDQDWTDIELTAGYTDIGPVFGKQVMRVVLPDTVKTLLPQVFNGCTALQSVWLPDGISEIPRLAFYDCTSLKEVRLPQDLSAIRSSAFGNCSSLTFIDLPESLRILDSYAFSTSGLNDIDLPAQLTTIGDNCFDKCYYLKKAQIPQNVNKLGAYAFSDCESLSGTIIVPDGITVLKEHCFDGCHSLTCIMLPQGLTTIEDYAMKSCFKLTDVEIPETVTSIGSGLFQMCYELKDMAWPSAVTVIPEFALAGTSIEEFVIPETVTSMGNNVFQHCDKLKKVTIQAQLTEIPPATFRECEQLSEIILPSSVTAIGAGAFNDCQALRKLDLPSNISAIGNGAFRGCTSLECFEWPASVPVIDSYMFMDCSGLRQLVIPDTVTTISDYVFINCGSLHSQFLPKSITYMHPTNDYAQLIFFVTHDADYLIQLFEQEGIRYYLTDKAEEIIKLPDGMETIEANAFQGTAAQEYRIPVGCKSIGSKAFADLQNGTVIVFSSRNIQIAEDAFDNSEVFFECLNGGPVMTYLQRKGFPVHLTYDGLWNN